VTIESPELASNRAPTPASRALLRLVAPLLLLVFALCLPDFAQAEGELKFPKPEFESGYDFPNTTIPSPTSELRNWIDVLVLFGALSLATFFAVKRRSRKGVFLLMVACLIYFGFYRQGCVCPIGSIQNVALSLFNSNYAVPITVVLFFVLPLAFALVFGRVFCASVCPLGAIQDLVVLKPINLHPKVALGLNMIPYVYLGTAVLLAATNTGFVICRYDPFIGFFRLNGNAPYLYLGAGFLLVGIFIGRPYCRFFCPYGVLLGWLSRFSKWHLSITPSECVQCRLCEETCPFDYIDKPNTGLAREQRSTGVHRLGFLIALVPVLIVVGGWIGHKTAIPLSRYNNTVMVAEEILAEKADPSRAREENLWTETFRQMGMPEAELMDRAMRVRSQMNMGGWLLGGFVGLVFGLKLIGLSTTRDRKDFEVHKSTCFSCARCCPSCPSDDMHKINFLDPVNIFELEPETAAAGDEAASDKTADKA
jgi:ferredoxin